MTRFPADRLDRAWTILIALTLVSMTAGRLGVAGLAGLGGLAADGVVLAAAVFKARQVLMDFLGLRTAPPGWRALFTWWLVLVAATAWIAAASRCCAPAERRSRAQLEPAQRRPRPLR